MPSGLLQTVLCEEKLQTGYTRIDELFYYIMQEIVSRLEENTEVKAPVDNNRDLTPRKSDTTKMVNWRNRLKSKLEDLKVLFSEDCTKDDALQAWYGFFNHKFWNETKVEASSAALSTVQKADIAQAVVTEFRIINYSLHVMQLSETLICDIIRDGIQALAGEIFNAYNHTNQKPSEAVPARQYDRCKATNERNCV